MMRLEVLDSDDKIISTHKVGEGLTLIGKSPSAHIQLSGKEVGSLHIAIKNGKKPVIMDLGGPVPLKINGSHAVEHEIMNKPALLEFGQYRIRVTKTGIELPELHRQKWEPIVDLSHERRKDVSNSIKVSKQAMVRARLYVKGKACEVLNSHESIVINPCYGTAEPFKVAYKDGKNFKAVLPQQWIGFGGRIQVGKDKIQKLDDWATPVTLEKDTIYRVFAGAYVLELLVSNGSLVIGAGRPDFFPKEFRKPFAISASVLGLIFTIMTLLTAKEETKPVEEPFPVYARIQNVPVEKIEEPKQAEEASGGGGSGSQSKENTAPQIGGAASTASALAQSLTGGLKNLIGSAVSAAKPSAAVVSETGIANLAHAVGGGTQSNTVGKLSAVGAGNANVAGAAKLGNFAIAGSGKGFSGGSGTGLGSGVGSGIGSGVGNGIGRGSFKIVEEESIVDGGLDKSVIAAVIQNNLSQIKYCYERQLVAEPDLFGKVVVNWQINAQGNVQAQNVKQTTLNSAPVEQCMLMKIAGWKFPQPKNGSTVTVSYPFLFKSTK